jgi:hypothetical protein
MFEVQCRLQYVNLLKAANSAVAELAHELDNMHHRQLQKILMQEEALTALCTEFEHRTASLCTSSYSVITCSKDLTVRLQPACSGGSMPPIAMCFQMGFSCSIMRVCSAFGLQSA